MNERFFEGFASGTGLSRQDAEDQWGGYSRNMDEADRRRTMGGGYRAGERAGREFRRAYPDEEAVAPRALAYTLRNIPRDLWTLAKHRAVDEGQSLRGIIIAALRAYLVAG
jgi:hypothetical protein